MKKVSLFCIGVVVGLFLTVGVYTAQAQDLSSFNGAWLKLTVKPQKGLEFTGYDSTSAPRKMQARGGSGYVCVDIDEAAPQTGYLRFFEKDGTPMGDGILHWDAGTNLEFLGYLEASLADEVDYVPGIDGFPAEDSLTDTYLQGYVNVAGKAADKIKIKSVSGEGWIQSPDATETTGTYAGFGYTLNGRVAIGKKIPQITPACGEMVFPPPAP